MTGSLLSPNAAAPAIALRPYQAEAVAAVYDHLRKRDGNPCIVCPTGAGKSLIIAQICQDAVSLWQGRVLVLSHVKELLVQNAEKIKNLIGDNWVGLYSAGLQQRDMHQPVIVAGIQSIYKKADQFEPFNLVICDECHLIPASDEGMWRSFLADAKIINPHLRVIGTTATPFRLSSGLIYGPERILTDICYEISVRELIVQGYLCPLKSKAGLRKVDTSDLHIRGGEFIAAEIEQLMDDDALVQAACREMIEHTQDRHTVLIFAAGIQHARHVQATLEKSGHECGFVCGDTLPFEREETIRRFKSGELKFLVNINVLTTGFDAPNIDCVVLLRPTNSPGLYYQQVGRSFRLHPSKKDSLVLDFGGNILRHGPVDDLQIQDRTAGSGEAPAKECPECQAVIHAAFSLCPECGYEFPPPEKQKHDQRASEAAILSGEVTITEYPVEEVFYSIHTKRDNPDGPKSMRVEYQVGYNNYKSEWICFEHAGYARSKAEQWWRARSHEPIPDTAAQAVAIADAGGLAETKAITVRSVSGEKYDRITNYQLGPIPPRLDGSEERDDGNLPEYVLAEGEIPF